MALAPRHMTCPEVTCNLRLNHKGNHKHLPSTIRSASADAQARAEGDYVPRHSAAPPSGFCTDCPDHEACATGMPCALVKTVNDH